MIIFTYLLGLVFLQLVCGHPYVLEKRAVNTTDLIIHKNAVLAINGEVSSCEVVLLGQGAGYVAANCFDFDNGLELTTTTQYSVYFNKGVLIGFPEIFPLDISDIHIHPDYDPTSFANNIAVVVFNKQTLNEFDTYDYTGSFKVNEAAVIRRTYERRNGLMLLPSFFAYEAANADLCSKYSGFVSANPGWLTCNMRTTSTIENPDCKSPYSSIYAKFDAGLAFVAIYSHTVIIGDDICGNNTQWINYYTYLKAYRSFAFDILQYPIKYISGDEIVSYMGGKGTLKTKPPLSVDLDGTNTIGGNLFKKGAPIIKDNSGDAQAASSASSSESITTPSTSNTLSSTKPLAIPTKTSSKEPPATPTKPSSTEPPATPKTSSSTESSVSDYATGSTDSDSQMPRASGSFYDDIKSTDNLLDNDQETSDYKGKGEFIAGPDADENSMAESSSETVTATKPRKNVTVIAILLPILLVTTVLGFGFYYKLRKLRKAKEQWDVEDARLNELFSAPRKRVRSSNPLAITRPNTMPLRDGAKLVKYVDIGPSKSVIQNLESRFAGLKSKFSFSLPVSEKSDNGNRKS